MTGREIEIELSPTERQALLRWNYTPEVRDQLEPLVGSSRGETIRVPRSILGWLISDLNHAIVKRGCRDDNVIDVSERLEYVVRTGDGSWGY